MGDSREVKDYFSEGFFNLIEVIRPYRESTEAVFPYKCHDTRISSQETVHEWFRRIVDSRLDGKVSACEVEANMGVLAHLRYRDRLITYANIQVVVARADLETFYADGKTPCSYLRFDYDPGCLGEMFKEPLPHIHTVPKEEPRFGQIVGSGNAVIDFFDFIYRSFYHSKWVEWVHRAYLREGPACGRKEDVFDPIEKAFISNKAYELATVYGNSLNQIKSACRALKERLFSAKIDIHTAAMLGYEFTPLSE